MLLPPPAAWARVSSNVSPGRHHYDVIDRLEALKCAYPTFRALQPQSYLDLRSAIDVGEAAADDEENVQARCRLPRWLRRERDLMLRPSQPTDAVAQLLLLDDDAVTLDGIEAAVTPAYPLRDGRPYYDGANLIGEFQVNGETGRGDWGLGFSLTPGFVGGLENFRTGRGQFYLQEGYVKGGYKWLELLAGKTALRFGNIAHGGLLLSGTGRPVTLLKLALRPHLLGAPLKFLGPFTFETWFSDQGTSAFVNGSRLWGIALGARPLTWLEIAVLQLYQFGGTGVPGLTLSDHLKMLVYWSDVDLENKRQGHIAAHVNLWGPGQTFKLYFQAMFDSLDEFSPLAGLWIPELGPFDLRLELVRTALDAYRNGLYPQGLTYKGTTLGHPVGPDGQGIYLDVGLPWAGDLRPSLGLRLEERARNPRAGLATETRYGATFELRRRWLRMEVAGSMAYTHTQNKSYVAGAAADGFAGYGTLRYTFF